MFSEWMKKLRKGVATILVELAERLDPIDPPDHGWMETEGGPPRHWVDYICQFDPEILDERGHLRHPAGIPLAGEPRAPKPDDAPRASSVEDRQSKDATRQNNRSGSGSLAGDEEPRDKIETSHPTYGKRVQPPKMVSTQPVDFRRDIVHHRVSEPQLAQPCQSNLSRALQFRPKPVAKSQHDTAAKDTAKPEQHPVPATPNNLERSHLRWKDAHKDNDPPRQNRHRHSPLPEKKSVEQACLPHGEPCPDSAPVEPSQPFQPEENVPTRLSARLNGQQILSQEEKITDPRRHEIPASKDRLEKIGAQGGRLRNKPPETRKPTAHPQWPCLGESTPPQIDSRWPCLPQELPIPDKESLLRELGLQWMKRDHLEQEQRGNPWRE